jgi:hypothetical protein
MEHYEPHEIQVEQNPKDEILQQFHVYDYNTEEKQIIYQDRTFDKIVTKYKGKIFQ